MGLRGGAAALATMMLCGCVGGGSANAASASAEGRASGPSGAATSGHLHQVPRTLAHAVAVGSQPLTGPRRIDFVGVHWRGTRRDGASVRFRRDGEWTTWQPLHAGELHPPGRVATELVSAIRATAYQVRAPQGASDVRAVAINTTDGKRETVSPSHAKEGGARVLGLPDRGLASSRGCYRSRALWGADESLRFDTGGTELWPPAFFPAQRLTVHHTVTDPATEAGETEPATIIRAIYRYHTVDLAFGDIGYQLLIDQQGCVYEGRYSGPDPLPVYEPPTTPRRLQPVNGGHTLGYNAGNIGIALVGDFNEIEPSKDSLRSLTVTLAALALVGGLDPEGRGTYVNPISGTTRDTDVISGHRDWLATECPGDSLYARLPELRENVASLLSAIHPSSLVAPAVP